jgi:hypothetical protein
MFVGSRIASVAAGSAADPRCGLEQQAKLVMLPRFAMPPVRNSLRRFQIAVGNGTSQFAIDADPRNQLNLQAEGTEKDSREVENTKTLERAAGLAHGNGCLVNLFWEKRGCPRMSSMFMLGRVCVRDVRCLA